MSHDGLGSPLLNISDSRRVIFSQVHLECVRVHHEQLRTRAVRQELTEWTRTGDLVAQFFEAADVVILFQVFHNRTKIGVAQRARDADW